MFLSIIVPIFNTKPDFIKECLLSIKEANISSEYEVIIINDGSTNSDTLHAINALNNEYTIIHQHNKGLAEARNVGIENAKGTFILPLDSDDKLHPSINNAIKKIQDDPNYDIFYGNYKIFGDCTKDIITKKDFEKLELIFQNQIAASSFYKKSVWTTLGGYDSTFTTIEDWDFWIRCIVNNFKFKKIDEYIYFYRVLLNGESLIQKTSNLIPDFHKKILEKTSLAQISTTDLNNFFLKECRLKKRRAIYLLIYLIAPKFFNRFLSQKKFWN